jgi:hypothetical protein
MLQLILKICLEFVSVDIVLNQFPYDSSRLNSLC